MDQIQRWTVVCQKAEDDTGDLIIDLPPELLEQMGLTIGDELALEKRDGVVVLQPVRRER